MTGEPSYVELGVAEPDRAKAFFGALLGWSVERGQVSTPTLDIGVHGGDPRNVFEVFFAVDDLAASLARVRELGGAVTSEINHSPGFGRWAECADDQGTIFGLRQV